MANCDRCQKSIKMENGVLSEIYIGNDPFLSIMAKVFDGQGQGFLYCKPCYNKYIDKPVEALPVLVKQKTPKAMYQELAMKEEG